MKVRYDPQADAVYFALADGLSTESEEVSPGVVLDFDAEGRVIGLEVLQASKTLAPGDWQRVALTQSNSPSNTNAALLGERLLQPTDKKKAPIYRAAKVGGGKVVTRSVAVRHAASVVGKKGTTGEG